MAEPEYLICVNCETACYVFEWNDERVVEALCAVCGNDDPTQFITEEEFDEMAGEREPG